MRIAPIGIAYRNASDDVLHKAVVDAILCTHTHPQSVDAAFVHAKAISVLVKTDAASFSGPVPLLETLLAIARTDVIRSTIQKVLNQV
jgi:ADP-ribosylglycohydrolase